MSLSGANVGGALTRLEEEIGKQNMAFSEVLVENHNLKRENEEIRKFTRYVWGLLVMNEPQEVWQSLVEDAKKSGIM